MIFNKKSSNILINFAVYCCWRSESILMILQLLLKTLMIWMIFIKSIEDYSPNKKRKIIVFDDMIADMLSNKKRNPILTELFV